MQDASSSQLQRSSDDQTSVYGIYANLLRFRFPVDDTARQMALKVVDCLPPFIGSGPGAQSG
jgi:hypothetical protein